MRWLGSLVVLSWASCGVLLAAHQEIEKRYDGLTLRQWSDRLGQLDPRSPEAAELVPALIAIIADEELPSEARRPFALTLGRIGGPARGAVPVLIAQIQQRDRLTEPTYLWAARALGFMGVDAQDAAPALIDLAFDPDVPVAFRTLPIEGLARIGAAHPAVLPALVRLLQYQPRPGDAISAAEASVLREVAAEALALVGSDAALAVPLLIRAVRNGRESESMRRKSIETLGALGPVSRDATPALLEVLELGTSLTLREVAGNALGQIGGPAVPVLVRSLGHSDPTVRRIAAAGLARAGAQARPAVETLLGLLQDEDAEVRIQVCETLEALGVAAERFVRELIELLTCESRQVRMRAMRLLIALGPRVQPYLDRLRQLGEHERSDVRAVVRTALRQLEQQ